MATQLNIVLTGGAGTVVIPIPAGLQSLDSGLTAASQTGFSAVDSLVRSIFKAGGFYDGKSTWYPVSQIASITSS
jgi:hypothetical protein